MDMLIRQSTPAGTSTTPQNGSDLTGVVVEKLAGPVVETLAAAGARGSGGERHLSAARADDGTAGFADGLADVNWRGLIVEILPTRSSLPWPTSTRRRRRSR